MFVRVVIGICVALLGISCLIVASYVHAGARADAGLAKFPEDGWTREHTRFVFGPSVTAKSGARWDFSYDMRRVSPVADCTIGVSLTGCIVGTNACPESPELPPSAWIAEHLTNR
jgi:hypothetical protein